MAERDFQERTEQATPRRRRQAREEGQVARSLELNAAAIICLGFAALYVLGPSLAGKSANLMTYIFTNAPFIAKSDHTFFGVFTEATMRFMHIILPIFAVMVVVAVGINVVQVGFDLSPKVINPNFDKIDPMKGFKRIFSSRSLFTAVRDTLKLIVVGIVAYKVIDSEFSSFFLYSDMTIGQLASSLGALTFSVAIKIGICILAIAIIDYLYQRHEYEKSIRMSKQEIKEEMKDTEGNPQLKARVRQIQREMSKKRMMAAVPTADVVVTNPTHIAVALKYEKGEDNAPFVIAKGERLIAQKIKEIALESGVPIVEDKPLARSLFKMCDIGDVVPETLYRAVAELLAYVYKLKNKVIN